MMNELTVKTAEAAPAGFWKGQPWSPSTVKFKTEFQGIPINVDRPKGFIMKGTDAKGNAWARRYKYDYGFIPKTLGGDGDGLDVFIGPLKKAPNSFWAVQRKDDGSFDEYKIFLGFPDRDAAVAAYRQHIPKKYFKGIITMKVEMMKAMLGKVNPDEQIKRASVAAFMDELGWMARVMEKSAEEGPDGGMAARTVGAAGLGVGAKRVGEDALERLLGAQRFSHGTSREAAKNILREGLDPAYGGGETGGGAAIKNTRYLQESKGRVHVARGGGLGRRLIAGPHASLSDAHVRAKMEGRSLSNAEAAKAFMRGFLPGHKGEIVGGGVPYEDFAKNFEQDPDQIPFLGMRSSKKIDPKQLERGKPGIRSIVKGRSRDLMGYIERNPGRFATGAGLGVLAPAMGYGAYRLVKPVAEEVVQ